MNVTRIPVEGEQPYEVVVGAAASTEVPRLIPPGAATVAVIHGEALGPVAESVGAVLRAGGRNAVLLPVPDGEAAKEIRVLAGLWSRLAAAGITRTDAVVGIGGGATTDLAGFAAASWLRGVPVILVPTTLLGMVDAAVGGKTAVNIPEGKNLVGAFHPPAGVVCDPAVLATVPLADHISGLAEVIKAGFIADPAILDLIEDDPAQAVRPDGRHIRELIERAVRVKAQVVSADLRESGLREMLNYGHTLGHAIERAESYRFRHGHAVAIGMVFAAELAHATGRLDAVTVQRHRSILTSVGLPTSYHAEAWSGLRAAMRMDKKARGTQLRMIVLDAVGAPAVLEGPDEELLVRSYQNTVHDH